MKSRFLFVIIFISFFVWTKALWASGKSSKKYQVTCTSVIFSDITNSQRLYGRNVDKKVLPASTAKVMTALIVLEELSLDQYITVHSSATRVQPSKIYLRPGERYKVRDLLYAVLIESANDASVALARAVAGSEEKFVRLMNERARQLGARHTSFTNSNGLPSPKVRQYTTAYDMYLIFRQALKQDFFKEAITYKYKNIYSKTGRKISLKNHNKILFLDWNKKIYGKTGYTKAAKSCFIGTVENGHGTFVIGVFGCRERWDDIKYVVSKYGGIDL